MRLVLALALGSVVVGCSTDPSGTRLELPTALGRSQGTCAFVAAAPFRIARDDATMVFVDVTTEERRYIVWPDGFAAWLESGVAVLYASDGQVVGREGDVLGNVFGSGSTGAADLRVCAIGVRTYT